MPETSVVLAGLVLGLLAAGGGMAVARTRPALVFVPAAVGVGAWWSLDRPFALVLAGLLGSLAAARPPLATALTGVLATVFLATNLPDPLGGADAFLFIVAAAVVTPLAVRSASLVGVPMATALLAITCVGIYGGPPDTEPATLAGIVIACGACAAWRAPSTGGRTDQAFAFTADPDTGAVRVRRVARPANGIGPTTLFVVWAAMDGAAGRPAAFLGALGAFGALLALPFVVVLARALSARGVVVLVTVHTIAAITAGRTGGLADHRLSALLLAMGVIVATTVVLGLARGQLGGPAVPDDPRVIDW